SPSADFRRRACGPRLRSAAPSLGARRASRRRSEEHTSELQSLTNLVCRLLLEKKKKIKEVEYFHMGRQQTETRQRLYMRSIGVKQQSRHSAECSQSRDLHGRQQYSHGSTCALTLHVCYRLPSR